MSFVDINYAYHHIVAFDANGDGNKDLAVTNAGGHSVAVLFGDGQGHLSSTTLYLTSGPPSVMLVTDVNQDGYSDLLLLNGSTCYTLLIGSANGIVTGATGTINILIFLGSIN